MRTADVLRGLQGVGDTGQRCPVICKEATVWVRDDGLGEGHCFLNVGFLLLNWASYWQYALQSGLTRQSKRVRGYSFQGSLSLHRVSSFNKMHLLGCVSGSNPR